MPGEHATYLPVMVLLTYRIHYLEKNPGLYFKEKYMP